MIGITNRLAALAFITTCCLGLTGAASCVASEADRQAGASLVVDTRLEQGAYRAGDKVVVSLSLKNMAGDPLHLQQARLVVRDLTADDGRDLVTVDLLEARGLEAGEAVTFEELDLWTLPEDCPPHAYGIYLVSETSDGRQSEQYLTYSRVLDGPMLEVFSIEHDRWQGLDVYTLDGGMSAEYTVEKSLEALTTGVSHSWHVNAPGSGPNHVYATPDFLDWAMKQTVEVYDRAFGQDAPIETVIITPGFASIPYLANTMKAPVLPIQFLVSFDTVKEVRGVLDRAAEQGHAAYTTVGHDPSVPMGVAWIKLLALPKPYADFIERHGVKRVLIMGCTGVIGGETKSRKVIRPGVEGEYQTGDIYIMYPGTSPDDQATLNEKIKDLEEFELQDEFMWVADWESGIAEAQINGFVQSLKRDTSAEDIRTVTAEDLIGLYNLAAYATAAFIHKNPDGFGGDGAPIKGVTLNPYLISHPWIETRAGYIPVVYWQGNPPGSTIGRVRTVGLKAVEAYFPETDLNSLEIHLNSSNNFGSAFFAPGLVSALKEAGYEHIRENDYTHDEVWYPGDGMQAPSELLAERLVTETNAESLKAWHDQLSPLTPDDLADIAERFPEFVVESR